MHAERIPLALMGVLRAAVYARLSRQKADAEMGLNIGDQQAIGKQLVERRGWALVPGPTDDTFTDDGRGAFKDDAKRPAWEAMLAAKPDIIVVRDAARLGRNFPDYTALLLTKAKVVVWLDDETGDVNWDAQAVSIDTEAFMSAQVGNRVYSQKIQKGVKRKNRLKAAAGAWPHGGTRPFGYHHPPQCCEPRGEDCQPGAIIEAEAKMIRDLAKRWLGGEKLSHLCADLADKGILTPAGKPWQYARLRNMLIGPRIAGLRTHLGVETKGAWGAIITEEMHQDLVAADAASSVRRAGQSNVYLLSDFIWCAACDRRMYGHKQYGGKKGEPHRSVRLRYICREGCGQGISLAHTEDFVRNRTVLAILAPQVRDQRAARDDMLSLREQAVELDSRLKDLDEAYWIERTIEKDRWVSLSRDLKAKRDEAQAQAQALARQLSVEQDLPSTAEALARRWQDGDVAERARLLRAGVSKVVVHAPRKGGRFDPTRLEIRLRGGQVLRLDRDEVLTVGEEKALMALAGSR
jgi:site-specific DNA recombinase